MNRALIGVTAIFFFLALGVVANKFIWSMIPSSIYGMVFLFIALQTKLIAEENIKSSAEFILANLTLFFIAPAVNVVMEFSSIQGSIPAIVAAIVVSTIAVVATVSLTCQYLIKRKNERDNR